MENINKIAQYELLCDLGILYSNISCKLDFLKNSIPEILQAKSQGKNLTNIEQNTFLEKYKELNKLIDELIKNEFHQ